MRYRRWSFLPFSAIVVLLVLGCSSGSSTDEQPVPLHVIEPDAEAVKQVEAAASADDLWFPTAETVDGLSYGLLGDGVTDNTVAFRSLLSNGNRTIHIPAGDYVTGKLTIPSNTVLILAPGVIIRDSGRLTKYDSLINIRSENVRIEGLGASIVARRSDYTTDEWRHGVYISGAKRVFIHGLESSSHGGDGFYIGGMPDPPSEDIVLRGCRAHNNRRQGLSITSARRVRVIDCEFVNTNGTAPQFGVDLEPDHPFEVLVDISFLRPHTGANQGGGIMICLNNLDASSQPVNVSIVEHTSVTELTPLDTRVPPAVRATLLYSRRY